MKKVVCISLIVLFPAFAISQNWQQVGQGFSFQTRNLFVDSVANLLYCTGGYTQVETLAVNGVAQWDGAAWDSVPFNQHSASSLVRYNNELYFTTLSQVLKWDGNQVDTIAECSGVPLRLHLHNGDLYAFGGFDTINGVAASNIAKYDGSSWSALDTTQWGGFMTKAITYQGNLYVSGNFTNYNASMDRLAMWDGIQWSPVGNNILEGGLGGVNCFAIYNGDLWIGGLFNQPLGNPYDGIACWNGTQWLDPGGGITSFSAQPFAMQVFNNELWMVGNFSTVAGIPAQFIARWNGTDWCATADTFAPGGIGDIAVYNNELYICGGFRTINGDTMNYIAKWIGGNNSDSCGNTTGIDDPGTSIPSVSFYPNPVTDVATFGTTGTGTRTIIVFDALGREVWRCESDESRIEFSAENLAPGIYLFRVEQPGKIYAGKFVVSPR